MVIRRGFEPCREADSGRAVAIGNFDGLHLGHQAILAVLRERGGELRLPTTVVCFEPQPKGHFQPDAAPALESSPSPAAASSPATSPATSRRLVRRMTHSGLARALRVNV